MAIAVFSSLSREISLPSQLLAFIIRHNLDTDNVAKQKEERKKHTNHCMKV
jgi:hypothetical protein